MNQKLKGIQWRLRQYPRAAITPEPDLRGVPAIKQLMADTKKREERRRKETFADGNKGSFMGCPRRKGRTSMTSSLQGVTMLMMVGVGEVRRPRKMEGTVKRRERSNQWKRWADSRATPGALA
jgi:hypothetical protein